MGGPSSNAGFIGLMTPQGISILVVSALLLVAIINFGSGWVKAGEAKARAERAELKKWKEESDRKAREENAER